MQVKFGGLSVEDFLADTLTSAIPYLAGSIFCAMMCDSEI